MLAVKLPDDAPTAFDFLNEPAANEAGHYQRADATTFKPLSAGQYQFSAANPEKQYPIFYYCRGGISDRAFIRQRMHIVPAGYRHSVSEQYEQIYLSNGHDGRRLANTWLDAVARRLGGRL